MCFIQYLNCASSGYHISAEAYILKNVLQEFSLFNMKCFVFIFTFLGKLLSDKIHHFHSTIYTSKLCQMFLPHYWCHTQVSLGLTITSLKTHLIKTSTSCSLSGYWARQWVADSRGPVLVAGLSLNKIGEHGPTPQP
jgi:hypothetical protein